MKKQYEIRIRNARPELKNSIDLSGYDTIYLGYPNWWGDMPMAVYTFLEQYDLSGKTVIVFVCYGGSRASSTLSTVKNLQPDANVSDNVLTVIQEFLDEKGEENQ